MDEIEFERAEKLRQMEVDAGIARAAAMLPAGEGADECVECSADIPAARRAAVPGVELCFDCASIREARRG